MLHLLSFYGSFWSRLLDLACHALSKGNGCTHQIDSELPPFRIALGQLLGQRSEPLQLP